MALFQSYEKIFKWYNNKTAKKRKIVDMKLRNGKKTINDSLTCEIEIPNKKSKKNANEHSGRIVKLVKKKEKKNDVLNHNSISRNNRSKSKCKTSNSNYSNSLSGNKKSRQWKLSVTSMPNEREISHSSEVLDPPSTSVYLPVSTANQSVIFDSSELRDQPSTSLHLRTTSTSKQSFISGSCGIREPHSTSSHLPTSSTPNELSKTTQSVGTSNKCTGNSMNIINSSKSNYYSPISDTSLTDLNIISIVTVPKNSTIEDSAPLTIDATNTTRNRPKRKKCSILGNIINQEQDINEEDKVRNSKKRKRSVSVKSVLSSVEISEQTEKDDKCSVISVQNDEDIVVLENEVTSNLRNKNQNADNIPPSKRQKTSSEVLVIDLCTPEPPSTQSRIMPKGSSHSILPFVHAMKNLTKSKHCNIKKSLNESDKKILHPINLISQNKGPSISEESFNKSRKALKEYMSIMGTVTQRGPFPHASSTVTSSNETEPRHKMNLPDAPSSVTSKSIETEPRHKMNLPGAPSSVTSKSIETEPRHKMNLPDAPSSVISKNTETEPRHRINLPDVPTSSKFGSNIYNPNPIQLTGLRPIVIDGSNVAFGHSNGAYFSCRGLKFCIDFFLKRNHKVLAFVPQFRRHHHATKDALLLEELQKQGLVSFTPSRKINGKLVVPYDDRYIVQYAAECGGIIVSTDNYRDLVCENPTLKETIEKRLLMFTWAGDILIFPQDPLGRHGPSLENFLRFR